MSSEITRRGFIRGIINLAAVGYAAPTIADYLNLMDRRSSAEKLAAELDAIYDRIEFIPPRYKGIPIQYNPSLEHGDIIIPPRDHDKIYFSHVNDPLVWDYAEHTDTPAALTKRHDQEPPDA